MWGVLAHGREIGWDFSSVGGGARRLGSIWMFNETSVGP